MASLMVQPYEGDVRRALDDLEEFGAVVIPMRTLYRAFDTDRLGRRMWRALIELVLDAVDDNTATVRVHRSGSAITIVASSDRAESAWNCWADIESLAESKADSEPSTALKITARTVGRGTKE